jgi:hypothetical protein
MTARWGISKAAAADLGQFNPGGDAVFGEAGIQFIPLDYGQLYVT